MGTRSDRRGVGSVVLLVTTCAVTLLTVLGQSFASPPELPSGYTLVEADAVSPRAVSDPRAVTTIPAVSTPVLVLNSDGSASLSASLSLASAGDEVALASVQIVFAGARLEVASTDMWLPVLPGVAATVGAASDAGGFVVPHGLAAGDIADVYFLFDNRGCAKAETPVVSRSRLHKSVFPKNGVQLGPATSASPTLPSACSALSS